jgi:hypothetical protein
MPLSTHIGSCPADLTDARSWESPATHSDLDTLRDNPEAAPHADQVLYQTRDGRWWLSAPRTESWFHVTPTNAQAWLRRNGRTAQD